MTLIKKITDGVTLEKDLTEFEIKDREIEPCPVCAAGKIDKTKSYYIVGDPIAVCVSHKPLALRTASKLYKELDALKTGEEATAKAKELWPKWANPNSRWLVLFQLGRILSRKWKKNGEALHKKILSLK